MKGTTCYHCLPLRVPAQTCLVPSSPSSHPLYCQDRPVMTVNTTSSRHKHRPHYQTNMETTIHIYRKKIPPRSKYVKPYRGKKRWRLTRPYSCRTVKKITSVLQIPSCIYATPYIVKKKRIPPPEYISPSLYFNSHVCANTPLFYFVPVRLCINSTPLNQKKSYLRYHIFHPLRS